MGLISSTDQKTLDMPPQMPYIECIGGKGNNPTPDISNPSQIASHA
jgi:hypothetical protein